MFLATSPVSHYHWYKNTILTKDLYIYISTTKYALQISASNDIVNCCCCDENAGTCAKSGSVDMEPAPQQSPHDVIQVVHC